MWGIVLKILGGALEVAENLISKKTAEDALKHEWMTVALARRGKLVRDKRCRHCGTFRRSPVMDDHICKARR